MESRNQFRKYIDEAIQKAIKASKKMNINYFQLTERRLYAYPMLEDNIKIYEKDIEDLKVEDFGKAKDIVVFSPSSTFGDKPDVDEIREAKIQIVRSKINRDKAELKEIKRALERIKEEEYYKVIQLHYFKKLSKEDTAKMLNCSETTAWRQRKRLVSLISLALYGADTLK